MEFILILVNKSEKYLEMSKGQNKISVKFASFVVCVFLLGVGTWLAGNRAVWNDEIYTQVATVSARSYPAMLAGNITEAAISPLFYILQKVIGNLFGYKPPMEWITDKGYDHVPSRIILHTLRAYAPS